MPRMSDLEIIGPLGVRRFKLEKVCDAHHGHAHHYDHDTIVISGSIKVIYDASESRVYGPGSVVFIAANVQHTVKAMEPHTQYLCVFSHRDFEGRVSQEYVGNPDACEHANA